MRTIPLTKGKIAIVDDEDYEWLSTIKWHTSGSGEGYATRSRKVGEKKEIYMHRMVCNATEGAEVDHKNRNHFDNRKVNLRVCNGTQNQSNKPKSHRNKLGVKGVFKKLNRYVAQIRINGKPTKLGSFTTLAAASIAYQEAQRFYRGEFAHP